MNRLHAMTMIQRDVLETDTIEPKDVYMRLRHAVPETVMVRKELEAIATQFIASRKELSFGIEKDRLLLDVTEAELRADVLDALDGLDRSNPRDCRDIWELHRQVGNSTGEASLRTALDHLREAAVDTAALEARFAALFPPTAVDE